MDLNRKEYMLSLITAAFHEKRKFSLTPFLQYEIENSLDHTLDQDEIEYVSKAKGFKCCLCGGQLHSHGHDFLFYNADNKDEWNYLPHLAPVLECKDEACKEVRRYFDISIDPHFHSIDVDGVSFSQLNRPYMDYEYLMIEQKLLSGGVDEKTIDRRRKLAISHNDRIRKVRFTSPDVDTFDLLLAEVLRQSGANKKKELKKTVAKVERKR